MIAGIGVDIAEVLRFEKMLDRYADRIVRRILCEAEWQQFERRNRRASFLASRFAAKEAVSKALGTGIAQGIGFHSIEVINDEQGKPELRFHDGAKALVEQRGITSALLSLSDEKHYVVAMVVLEAG
jgi:holo-[acyl-carrier protein] synthase